VVTGTEGREWAGQATALLTGFLDKIKMKQVLGRVNRLLSFDDTRTSGAGIAQSV
jgi:hypothetical protein